MKLFVRFLVRHGNLSVALVLEILNQTSLESNVTFKFYLPFLIVL